MADGKLNINASSSFLSPDLFSLRYYSLAYRAPARTGSDRLGKLVFNDDFLKDIVVNTLLDLPGSSFHVGNNGWQDGSAPMWYTNLCSRLLYQSSLLKSNTM
ncbi:predicted protein [Lichtheimia corymbifera JMRC:FSU:9682]|uniref:Uncharacterized protein n=1 Tax=Lichtheimia corymbifera JMRC:FSU:9682 TaxID=1263082 RepID=A0A068S8T7_9FUNG|nr:predicted protein [Lichtheimia corymbifera JMRC:FSU:9682]